MSWWILNQQERALPWLEEVLRDMQLDAFDRTRAQTLLGSLCIRQGDAARALSLFEEALPPVLAHGDLATEALVRIGLGLAHLTLKDYARANETFLVVREQYLALEDP